MDDKLFGVLSTLGGLVVGWILNETSSTFKYSRENKQVLNQLLFLQLEIRDILKKTNFSQVEKQIKEILVKRFPSENIDSLNNVMGKLFYGFIQNELNNKFSKRIRELMIDYKENITTLAKTDPFATYYISNKDVVLDYLGYINTYLTGIEEYLDKQVFTDNAATTLETRNNTFRVSFDRISDQITPLIRDTAIETIEKDIRVIAKKIGFTKYLKTKRFIMRTNDVKIDSVDIKKIEFYMDSVSASTAT